MPKSSKFAPCNNKIAVKNGLFSGHLFKMDCPLPAQYSMNFLNSQFTKSIDQHINAIHSDLVAFRKCLHRIPELAFEEIETTRQLREQVELLGLNVDHEKFDTGFVVDVENNPEGKSLPLVCLRADIDAVNNSDEKECDYKSQNRGAMHGCGHDVHATILLGALSALAKQKNQPNSPEFHVRAIFQPAEENACGARYMMKLGTIDGADSIFALHVDPRLDCGVVAVQSGPITALCDEVEIVIEGQSGHAARPYESIDPIQAAAQLINAIYVNVPRSIDPRKGIVITFGSVDAGNSHNVIPNRCSILGTIRCHDAVQRQLGIESLRRTVDGIAKATNTKIELNLGKHLPAVNNSPQLYEIAHRAGVQTVGENNVIPIELPSLGGEDFAFYQTKIPGFLIRVGSSSPELGYPPLHSSRFDVEPDTIRVGVGLMTRCALLASQNRGIQS